MIEHAGFLEVQISRETVVESSSFVVEAFFQIVCLYFQLFFCHSMTPNVLNLSHFVALNSTINPKLPSTPKPKS